MDIPEFDDLKGEIISKMESLPNILLQPTFDLIFELLDNHDVYINVPKYNILNLPANLIKNENGGFIIEIGDIFCDMSESYEIEIIIGDRIFIASDLYISMHGATLKRNEHNKFFTGQMKFTGQISKLHLKTTNDKESYNRFIIPIRKSQVDYYIDTTGYRDELLWHAFGRLPLVIDTHNIVFYENKYKDKYYFIIDSQNLINSEQFSNICHAILIGYGFLSAEFVQNEAFYFKSNDANFALITDFSYLQLRPSIISSGTYNPIYSNPYGYEADQTIIDEIGNKIQVFDFAIFSSLCTRIYLNPDYATLLLLIIEANASSLILKPAGYSVALEKITNIIVDENKGLKPIPNKMIARAFRKKLNEVLLSFKEKIEESGNADSVVILQKNIDKINNPTNRDKLTKPFEIYGILLGSDEINAIDNRNDFLHGHNIELKEGSNEFMEVWLISMRLNKLINKLILKHIGYSGYIVNHVKYNEKSLGIEINESLFEKI